MRDSHRPSFARARRVVLARRGADAFWARLKRWFFAAAAVGLLVGLATTGLHQVVYALLWKHVESSLTPLTTVLLPLGGLMLSGALLRYGARDPDINGTEEVIGAFHHAGGLDVRSAPAKTLAAIATLGFGGAAGLEGPSIYLGGVIGSWSARRLRRFGFTAEDVRTLMLAGAAAGVAAIFKAPLTGIVFALEVPYKDDLAREALIPALVASVSSYLVLVSFLGVEPLFRVTARYSLSSLGDLGFALLLGLLVGAAARMFVLAFKRIRHLALGSALPLWARTALGGLAVGLLGLVGDAVFHAPLVLGTGYDAVSGLLNGRIVGLRALWLLLLKAAAVLATLGSGAAGGMFIPLIVLGAAAGAALGGLAPSAGPLFPVVGMAAFLAAGYHTPIAAAVFIAETTGGSGYIIPGLVAAAVAYTVAGRRSVSGLQRWRRETRLDRVKRMPVDAVMTAPAIAADADLDVETFVRDFIVRLRHKGFPVVRGGRLVGMAGLTDVDAVPRERWSATSLAEAMTSPALAITPKTSVGDVAAMMSEHGYDRLPVVDADDPRRLVGIVSSTDLLAIEELAEGLCSAKGAEARR